MEIVWHINENENVKQTKTPFPLSENLSSAFRSSNKSLVTTSPILNLGNIKESDLKILLSLTLPFLVDDFFHFIALFTLRILISCNNNADVDDRMYFNISSDLCSIVPNCILICLRIVGGRGNHLVEKRPPRGGDGGPSRCHKTCRSPILSLSTWSLSLSKFKILSSKTILFCPLSSSTAALLCLRWEVYQS